MIAHKLVFLFWIAIAVVWIVGSFSTKQAVRRQSAESLGVQFVLTIGGYWLLFWPRLSIGILGREIMPGTRAVDGLGLLLALAGCLFAIWARVTLGGNWSRTVTVKQEHTLTTTGPYAYARHPIYSGLLLTSLGTAIVFGEVRCFLGCALILTGFWIKSRTEESFMEQAFGQQYSAYKQRVKSLIPGVL